MTLTSEQRDFRAAVRQLAEERFAPRAAEVDATGEFPWDNFKDCVSMELPGLAIPLEYGGSGADHVTRAIMVEELARVCGSTSLMMAINGLATTPIVNWGSEELKARYLPQVVTGEWQASYCLSEADAGSDAAAMTDPGRARRRLLRSQRHQVLDHQRRASPTSTWCLPRPTRPQGPGECPASWSSATTASASPNSSARWVCTAARPERSSSTTCAFPPPT